MSADLGPAAALPSLSLPLPPIAPQRVPGYGRYLLPWLRGTVAEWTRPGSPASQLNRALSGYPRNHDLKVVAGQVVPSRRLYARWKRIAALYPDRLTSLLDVGSCKGYFVLEAASRPTCRTAVGIDVHEPFIETARQAAAAVGCGAASFHLAPLDRFASDPALNTAAPYQTILLLNLYHYLFAGSEISPVAYHDHGPILSMLARLCSDRVIFSSPLELADCPAQVRDRAQTLGIGDRYTAAKFLQAASEFFLVEDHGLWGRRPLLVLRRRPN